MKRRPLRAFSHHAFYDPVRQRVERHLVSRCSQTVNIGTVCFRFDEGESLHTENSHKFTIAGPRELARQHGFQVGPVCHDNRRLFAAHWLHAP